MKLTQSCVPCTMLMVPGGKPASSASSISLTAVPGTRSEGLRTKVLPVAMASGYIHKGIMAGKLKGAMPAQTPSGCNHKGLVSRESLVPQQQQQQQQQQGSKQATTT
jgi:hypothetical protein